MDGTVEQGSGLTEETTYSAGLANQTNGSQSMAGGLVPSYNDILLWRCVLGVAVCCVLENLFVVAAVIGGGRLHIPKNPFLAHHSSLCLLNCCFIISHCCQILYFYEIAQPPKWCDLLGGAHSIAMVLVPFNLAATVVNQFYEKEKELVTQRACEKRGRLGNCAWSRCCAQRQRTGQAVTVRAGSVGCVATGLVLIWLCTLVLTLGVAFTPSNRQVTFDVGHCLFVYGRPQHYVINWLLILVISLILAITAAWLQRLREDLDKRHTCPEGPLVHFYEQMANVQTHICSMRNPRALACERWQYCALSLLVGAYVVQWYPLFILTLADRYYRVPKLAYHALIFLSWSYFMFSPPLCFLYIRFHALEKTALQYDHRPHDPHRPRDSAAAQTNPPSDPDTEMVFANHVPPPNEHDISIRISQITEQQPLNRLPNCDYGLRGTIADESVDRCDSGSDVSEKAALRHAATAQRPGRDCTDYDVDSDLLDELSLLVHSPISNVNGHAHGARVLSSWRPPAALAAPCRRCSHPAPPPAPPCTYSELDDLTLSYFWDYSLGRLPPPEPPCSPSYLESPSDFSALYSAHNFHPLASQLPPQEAPVVFNSQAIWL